MNLIRPRTSQEQILLEINKNSAGKYIEDILDKDLKVDNSNNVIYNKYLLYCKDNGEKAFGANKYFSQHIARTGL